MSSTPVFDVSSYLASLQGDLLTLQTNLQSATQTRDTAQTNLSNTNNQLQSLSRQYNQEPNGPSQDHINILQGLGNAINSYNSTITSSNTQISGLNTQISAIKDQITSAQNQVNTQNTFLSSLNRTVSSPSTGFKLPNLSNISPLFLIAGGALLLLILK